MSQVHRHFENMLHCSVLKRSTNTVAQIVFVCEQVLYDD